jgi:2-polyprenyl-3-methyl-5-hydroxy-6-metoxy-1,4-benzoquinol methylase
MSAARWRSLQTFSHHPVRAPSFYAAAAMPSRAYDEAIWQAIPPGLEPEHFALRLRFLLGAVEPGARVLDLGCGEGAFAAELARAGAEVLAVDVAQEPLRRARAAHPQLRLQLIDGEGDWELPDASYDLVWAGEVIEHVADTGRWLSELRRVLRSGGRLMLSTPRLGRAQLLAAASSDRAFASRFDPRAEHLRFYSSATLRELIASYRFEQISVRSAAGPPGARRLLLLSAVRARF